MVRPETFAYAEYVVNDGVSLTKIIGNYENVKLNLSLELDDRIGKTKIKAKEEKVFKIKKSLDIII